MRTHAIIIAGGIGSRMGFDIPKQFVEVYHKPILAYTLEGFQHHPDIDSIEVVCIDGWQDEVAGYIQRYGISKLDRIIDGGSSGQESIRNGVYALENIADDNDICVIHDGIRPLVEAEVLSDVLRVAKRNGNAVTSLPYNEQIFVIDDDNPRTTIQFIPRETLRRVSTPQAYRFDMLLSSYKRAFKEGIGILGSHYTNTMMVELGERLYFAAGSDKNIKLTTPADLELFKGYLRSIREESLWED